MTNKGLPVPILSSSATIAGLFFPLGSEEELLQKKGVEVLTC